MFSLLQKVVTTLVRDGFRSVRKKSYNRYKAWRLSRKIDLERETERWRIIKDRYKGKRVFVIGNGPSLNKTPLYLLKNEYKMCFNRFNIMHERLNWTPDFYLTTDNLVLSDLICELDEIVPLTTYSFFPGIHFRGHNYIKDLTKYPNIFWTLQIVRKGFSERLPKIYPGGTVIYEGFQILNHLGFSEIYLVGVDMNYRIHDTAKKLEDTGVDIISQNDDDPNHFDPRYFGKNRKYHQPEKYVIENTVKYLNYIASRVISDDFRIINVGFDSKLESFPKQEFHTLFDFSLNEKKEIFLNLLSKVADFNFNGDLALYPFSEYNSDKKLESLGSFVCSLDTALSIINQAIFTHIPVGPFEDKYYFINRNKKHYHDN